MKPAPFEYRRPLSLDAALATLAADGDEVSVLAGGQSLVPLLNLRLAQPRVLMDINHLEELSTIDATSERLHLGAISRARTVERHAQARQVLPVLSEALGHIGHPQIRNRTTIGGNVSHADPASELPAVLLALDGSVHLASAEGQRSVAACEFFQHVFTTARQAHELVVGIELPVVQGLHFKLAEVARRHGDYAMAGAVIGLSCADRRVADVRLAYFGVSTSPVRLFAVEDELRGATVERGFAERAGEAVREAIEPLGDLHAPAEYRRSLVATLTRRTVQSLLEAA